MLRPTSRMTGPLRRRGGGRGPGVYQPLCDGLNPEVEPFQGARSEYYEIAGLSKHDVVARSLAGDVDERSTGPTLEDRSVGLAEAPRVVPLYTEGFKNLGRDPRQFRSGVHQHGLESSSLARAGGVLDLDVYAEGSHVVGHRSS